MALLNAESPDVLELIQNLELEMLWHPSLSDGTSLHHRRLVDGMLAGEQRLDILVVEGAVVRGPGGTGMYDTFWGKPKKDILAGLAARARAVVAVGTCACFGGIGADGQILRSEERRAAIRGVGDRVDTRVRAGHMSGGVVVQRLANTRKTIGVVGMGGLRHT